MGNLHFAVSMLSLLSVIYISIYKKAINDDILNINYQSS